MARRRRHQCVAFHPQALLSRARRANHGARSPSRGCRPLPAPHDIAGLIAWTKRDEWRGALAALLECHCAEACAGAGIAPEEIEDVLGGYAASTLWGAAFEDLLATDLPDGRNIADDYLRRRGWKEGAATRDYIAGLRRSEISLHEVSGLVPGQSMLLRDLVCGGEPVRVAEKRGSEGLRRWDRIATRVVPLRDRTVISGTLTLFDRDASEALLASLREVRTRAPREAAAAAAREFGIAADAKTLAGVLTPDLLLAQAGFMFTNCWLDAALRAAQGRDRPELVNSDGDPLEFTTLHFPLLPSVTPQQIRQALATVPALRQAAPGFWNWLAEPGTKPAQPVPRRGRGQTFITTMDDGSLVLGTLALKGRRLSLEANSAARAERGRALLEPVLAGLAGPPLTERADLEQMLAAERPPPQPSGLSPEQERDLVHRALDDHYRRVLDEPVPALGGKSPRGGEDGEGPGEGGSVAQDAGEPCGPRGDRRADGQLRCRLDVAGARGRGAAAMIASLGDVRATPTITICMLTRRTRTRSRPAASAKTGTACSDPCEQWCIRDGKGGFRDEGGLDYWRRAPCGSERGGFDACRGAHPAVPVGSHPGACESGFDRAVLAAA
jgi:hypothetical protein